MFNFLRKTTKNLAKKSYSFFSSFGFEYFSCDGNQLSKRDCCKRYFVTPPLRRAIDIRATLGSSLKPIVRNREDHSVIENHPVLKLLQSPSYGVTTKEFLSQAIINYDVMASNFFVVKFSTGGVPLIIYNVSPIEFGTPTIVNGMIDKYTRSPYANNAENGSGGVEIIYSRDGDIFRDAENNQLWHMREYNPLSSIESVSKISTLDDASGAFNSSGKHNRNLIEKGCAPTGVVISKTHMSDEDYRTFKERLDENLAGKNNAGKFQLLEGDIEYKEAHVSPREMDWIKGREFDKRSIYELFAVPLALVTDTASTFNNLSTSMHMLYEFGIFPLLDKIYGEMTDLLMPYYGDSDKLEIYYSKEKIPSLEAITTENILNKSRTQIYTIDELRTETGLSELGGDIGGKLLGQPNPSGGSMPQNTSEEDETTKSLFRKLMSEDGYKKKQIDKEIEQLEKEGLL